MTKLSLNQAAKEANVAKSTVLKAIRAGRMSAPKNDKGHYEIDPAELFRVYPVTVEELPKEPQDTLADLQRELGGYQRENALLRETLQEAKTDRDEWRQQAQKNGNLLENMTKEPKGFWTRLFGG